jgi:hypothetical protein
MHSFALLCLTCAISAGNFLQAPAAAQPLRLDLNDNGNWIRSLAFSPDAHLVAAGTFKNKVILWDANKGLEHSRTDAPEGDQPGNLPYVVFSNDGKRLATVHDPREFSREGRARIRVWDIAANRELRKAYTFRVHAVTRHCGVWRVAFSPDSKTLVAADPDGTIIVWELATGKERLRFHGGVAASFSTDGRILVAVDHDGTIHHWGTGTTKRVGPSIDAGARDFIQADAVVFGPAGRRVAIGDGFTTCVKDVATGRTVRRLSFPFPIVPMAFSADDSTLVTLAKDGICLFSVETGKELAWRKGYGVSACSNNGQRFGWSDGNSVFIEKMPLMPDGEGKPPSPSDPAVVPLEARLIVNKKSYALDLGGLTPEEFSNEILYGYPPTPLVDLTLEIRNTSKTPVTIRRDGGGFDLDEPEFCLVGKSAMNISELDPVSSVGVDRKPRPILLAPGGRFSCRIVTLCRTDPPWIRRGSQRSYWLKPGEYTLSALCHGQISPKPEGASDAGEGYGYVSLHCAPVKLTVLPGETLSADPLEKTLNIPRLGALVATVDQDSRELRDKLSIRVTLDQGLKQTFQEAVSFLAERYDLDLRIDEPAFKKIGRNNIGMSNAQVAPLVGINLNYVLHVLLESVDATYEIRDTSLWIVPAPKPLPLADRLEPAGDSDRWLYRLFTLKPGIAKGTPLAKAVEELGDRAGMMIVLDRKAFERAGIKDIDKRPVELAEQTDVRFSMMLRELLRQADATFVARAGVILVVPVGK